MFWESVVAGFHVFTYWQTYVAGLIYSVFTVGPILLMGLIRGRERKVIGASEIARPLMLILPFLFMSFQVFASLVFVLTMSPILFGLSPDAAWSLPWALAVGDTWWMIKFVVMLTIALTIFSIIPLVGQLQTLHNTLLGCAALVIVVGLIGTINPAIGLKNIHYWPGGWFLAGLCILSLIAAFLAMGLVLIFSGAIGLDGAGVLIFSPVYVTFGFIPVFVYGAWLGIQLRG